MDFMDLVDTKGSLKDFVHNVHFVHVPCAAR